MWQTLRYCCFAVIVALVPNLGLSVAQDGDQAAQFLPESTVFYAKINHPGELLDSILEHPAVDLLQEKPEINKLFASPQFAMAMLGKGFIEQAIDDTLESAFKVNTAGGISLAFDPATQGVVIVFRSSDEAKLKRLAGAVLNMVGADAQRKGNEVPFKKRAYRDAKVAEFNGGLVARYKTWFLISNKPKLARKVVDAMHDGIEKSLASAAWFEKCQSELSAADIWAAVDLASLRQSGAATELFSGRTNNPGVELVLGGLLDALEHAPVATATLNVDRSIDVDVSVPFQKEWASKPRDFFFGSDLQGRAPPQLLPENLIASITSYRDISGWWLAKEELFEENVIAGLAQADSQLSTIFSGMDFGEDVLGALQPGIQIVVSENKFDERYVPDVKLPAFALVGQLKDVPNIQRRFKIAYQSVVGFANINLGMEGQPQLDLETETVNGARISSASYVFDNDTEEGLLLFNFAPTIAFRDQYFIVSSSRDLAIELSQLAAQKGKPVDSNTLMAIDGKMLAKTMRDNRESLITNNMLEEGNDRSTAAKQIDVLLSIADLIKESTLNLKVKGQRMSMKFKLSFADEP